MKAFYSKNYGGIDTMELGEVPNPKIKSNEILVHVKASSINPVDWKVRGGMMKFISGSNFPKIYGCDFAGVVSEVGSAVKNHKSGDKVYGYVPVMFGKQGANAEFVVATEENTRKIPADLTFVQAASLPVAALTALNVISYHSDCNGKKIVINGATGGVGHFAIQFAKAKGAIVTAVCSEKNFSIAKSLGVDQVIDYKKTDFTKENDKYDIVFDAFGKMALEDAKKVLNPKGFFMTTLPGPKIFFQLALESLFGKHKVVLANMRSKQKDYEEMERFIAEGKLKPIIGKEFPLENAKEAFFASESGGIVGKIMIVN